MRFFKLLLTVFRNMNVLITGSSGTGKSTVIKELKRRGYTAIDGDEEPGLSRLEIQETGEPTDWRMVSSTGVFALGI